MNKPIQNFNFDKTSKNFEMRLRGVTKLQVYDTVGRITEKKTKLCLMRFCYEVKLFRFGSI